MLEILNWFSESWWRVWFAVFCIFIAENMFSILVSAVRDILMSKKETK